MVVSHQRLEPQPRQLKRALEVLECGHRRMIAWSVRLSKYRHCAECQVEIDRANNMMRG